MGHMHDTRLASRRNLFVAAQLKWENRLSAVRIRNISGVGALVESEMLPPAETIVRLVRGQQSAHGHVVWLRGGRAGIVFSTPVSPDDWLPSRLKVRQGDKPIEVNADGRPTPGGKSGAHSQRDLIVAEHLVRIRTMVEDVRLDIAKLQLPVPAGTINKLDVIHRLLDWQVAELQP